MGRSDLGIRLPVPIAACLWLFGISTTFAEMDPATRAGTQSLHGNLLIAEENLSLALRKKDTPRAKLVNALLFHLSSAAADQKVTKNACQEALEGLEGTTTAVLFFVHPVPKGNIEQMTFEQIRVSEMMRPTNETLHNWFREYSALYRNKMPSCEQEIGASKSSRFLPERMPKK
jgi:hypothetical protein